MAELEPTMPKRFPGADLARLLRSLPRVDEAFVRTVEELIRAQPIFPESHWDRGSTGASRG